MGGKSHWEETYSARAPEEVSWFQAEPTLSLALIEGLNLPPGAGIIDVGGGASRLVDRLLAMRFERPAVLDISATALAHAQTRLGERAREVDWYEADITQFRPDRRFHLWHDRAVFHFLTAPEDRRRYVQVLEQTLVPGGYLIMATFALDGPERCSGLPVERYDAARLCAELGPAFELLQTRGEVHLTPGQKEQRFGYFLLQRRDASEES